MALHAEPSARGCKTYGYQRAAPTNIQEVPEWIAVLLVVEQQLDRLLSIFNRHFQAAYSSPVRVLALEEAAVAWDDVGTRVAGHFHETIRRVYNRIIGFPTFESKSSR